MEGKKKKEVWLREERVAKEEIQGQRRELFLRM